MHMSSKVFHSNHSVTEKGLKIRDRGQVDFIDPGAQMLLIDIDTQSIRILKTP